MRNLTMHQLAILLITSLLSLSMLGCLDSDEETELKPENPKAEIGTTDWRSDKDWERAQLYLEKLITPQDLQRETSPAIWERFFEQRGAVNYWKQLKTNREKLTFEIDRLDWFERRADVPNLIDEITEGILKYIYFYNLQVTYLRIWSTNDQQIQRLPAMIGELVKLTHLDLSGNHVIEFPTNFCNLVNLITLDLSRNQLTEIPQGICKLPKLENLYLRNNQLSELPEAISKLSNLEYIDLSENVFTHFPDVLVSLSKLKYLYLNSNQLSVLSPKIGRLSQLETLALSSNQLIELPSEIRGLCNLRGWNLGGNQLKSLPSEIKYLKKLGSLKLYDNPISSFPRELMSFKYLLLTLDKPMLDNLPAGPLSDWIRQNSLTHY